MKDIWELFLVFMQMGAVTFGGGYAMLPILTRELVDKRGWATDDELTDYYAIGQCTPGVIALNVATFVGNKKKGIPGALAASVGVVFVPVIIIMVIAAFLRNFADYPLVKDAFAGIRVCVCVLVVNAVLRLWKKSVVNGWTLCVFAAVFGLSAGSAWLPVSVSPVMLVIAAALAGLLLGQNGAGKERRS